MDNWYLITYAFTGERIVRYSIELESTWERAVAELRSTLGEREIDILTISPYEWIY